ncbi:hypothetical protein [Caulobacter sp. 17J65-9]|uniref:hypothetical protein n=1 Tax=Caulobacter sp. 17J65-9 TaxID=2709382 RepID=UPI0013CC2614|nr:hypothetical protein [Caulobacter sp. 17J65-9]NEX91580.1 hypothetical protein [Caulobacter sp. 17J65-9]
MVWWWWILPALVGLIGVAILLGGFGAMFRGKAGKGLFGTLAGALFLAVAAAAALLGLNVQTYNRLTYERPVATLELKQKGPRLYDAALSLPAPEGQASAVTRTYEIHGDEWRVEARVLKWKGWANVLGLDSQYQLDRLSGRYEDTESELHAERSVYDLRPTQQGGLDAWTLARKYKKYAPMVDALYGSGASMPMADGAKYEVWITQSGLIARPVNPQAEQASTGGWH